MLRELLRRSVWGLPGLALAAGLLCAAPASAAPETEEPTPSSAQLWEWYGDAQKLHDAEQLDQAWEIYKKIWKYRQTYDVAAAMGDICVQRAHFALAARYYRFTLDKMVPTQSPEYMDVVQKEYDRVRGEVTQVVEQVKPAGINGLVISDATTGVVYPEPIYLEPGRYTLKVAAPRYQVALREVTAEKGGTIVLDMELKPLPSPVGAKEKRLVKTRHPEIVFPLGGLVTAGLGTGAVLMGLKAKRKYDDGNQAGLTLDNGACLGQNTPQCVGLQNSYEDAEKARNTALILGGGALLSAVATGVVWMVWESDEAVEVTVGDSAGRGWKVGWTHAF